MLGHQNRRLDILKIDIEGEEYEVVRQHLFQHLKLLNFTIRQILIELHHNIEVL